MGTGSIDARWNNGELNPGVLEPDRRRFRRDPPRLGGERP
jgi:hypothetical protein